MSLVSLLGPKPNLLGFEGQGKTLRLEVRQPILTDAEMHKIRHIKDLVGDAFRTCTLDMTYPAMDGAAGMEPALKRLCADAHRAVSSGYNILILSDRDMSRTRVAIPALLATAAVHHHLIREGLRTDTGLVVETGEAREVHHFCALAGYGAEAINPYLAFESLSAMRGAQLPEDYTDEKLQKQYIKSVNKGFLKVMSKMGISTFQSYCGAQIFDAIGLSTAFIEQYFTGTASAVEGVGLAKSPRKRSSAIVSRSVMRCILSMPSIRVASTPCACVARATCGRPIPSPSCSMRCGAIRRRPSRNIPR